MLGRLLFSREGRNMKLTSDGERFIDQARKVVALNNEIMQSYFAPEISGMVRCGTPDDYADLFLPEVLGRFHRTHPLVTVDVECVSSLNLVSRIERSELDIALVTFCDNACQGEVLRREPMRWVTSARHNTHNAATLPVAVSDIGCAWRKAATDALDSAGRNFRIGYMSPNRGMIDAAVLQGLAVAALPEICIKPGMRVLTQADGFPPMGQIEIGLMRKPGKLSQAAEALANHIRESFGRNEDAAMIAAE
jgi:DNA-binding transcriptional LysR family regulator